MMARIAASSRSRARATSAASAGSGTWVACAWRMGRAPEQDGTAALDAAAAERFLPFRDYRAAITMISTPYFGDASLASTVARAGVLPGETQPSHTAFISAKVPISGR